VAVIMLVAVIVMAAGVAVMIAVIPVSVAFVRHPAPRSVGAAP
jgi:hypothetical protein